MLKLSIERVFNRNKNVNILLTDFEYQKIKDLSVTYNLNKPDFIRMLVNAGAEKLGIK